MVQWRRLHTFPAGAQVRFLVEELRSHKLSIRAKKKKKKNSNCHLCTWRYMFKCVHFSSGEKSKCPSSSIPVLFEHNQNSVAHGNSGWKRHTMTLNSGSMPSCEVSGKQPRDAQINMYHDIEKSIRPWRHYL